MMLASVDLQLGTVSLVSIPRDLVDVPLGNGDVFGPKLNSLYQYAAGHRNEFPQGPMRALQDAVGALLGVRVHYYAEADFVGFVRMVDLAGGVDVVIPRAIEDPRYDGEGLGARGFSLAAGPHTVMSASPARLAVGNGKIDILVDGAPQPRCVRPRSSLRLDGSRLRTPARPRRPDAPLPTPG
jgi:hypothetical protein